MTATALATTTETGTLSPLKYASLDINSRIAYREANFFPGVTMLETYESFKSDRISQDLLTGAEVRSLLGISEAKFHVLRASGIFGEPVPNKDGGIIRHRYYPKAIQKLLDKADLVFASKDVFKGLEELGYYSESEAHRKIKGFYEAHPFRVRKVLSLPSVFKVFKDARERIRLIEHGLTLDDVCELVGDIRSAAVIKSEVGSLIKAGKVRGMLVGAYDNGVFNGNYNYKIPESEARRIANDYKREIVPPENTVPASQVASRLGITIHHLNSLLRTGVSLGIVSAFKSRNGQWHIPEDLARDFIPVWLEASSEIVKNKNSNRFSQFNPGSQFANRLNVIDDSLLDGIQNGSSSDEELFFRLHDPIVFDIIRRSKRKKDYRTRLAELFNIVLLTDTPMDNKSIEDELEIRAREHNRINALDYTVLV